MHVGIAETFLVLGGGYFVFMMFGAALVRVPGPEFKPADGAGTPANWSASRCLRL